MTGGVANKETKYSLNIIVANRPGMGGTVPEWAEPSRNGRDSPGILGLVPVVPTVPEWAGQSRNFGPCPGDDNRPGMGGTVPEFWALSR